MLENAPATPRSQILVTGAAGRIGRLLMASLGQLHQMRGFDCAALEGTDSEVGNLTDLAALRRAMEGADVVVHLAGTKKEAPFVDDLVPNNVIGLYNVFEAARDAGVRRIVFASSAQSVAAYPAAQKLTVADPPRPSSLYGATKVLGETLGRFYFDKYGVEFVGLRIGWVLAPDDPVLRRDGYGRQIWLSPADTLRLFRCAVEKPDVGYAVVFGTSRTQSQRLSLHEARERLGYEPQDDVAAIPLGQDGGAANKVTATEKVSMQQAISPQFLE